MNSIMNEIKNYWLGLNSYSENDILYGRDKEAVELSEIIQSSVSSIMFGRSGIGKSSLLRAKIFPMLRYNDFFPVYVRLEHNGSIGYAKQIGNCIKDTVQTWNSNKSCLKVDVKFDEMTDNVCELVRSVEFVEIDTSIRKTLVLVLDQFEEIFTITDHSHKEEVDRFFSQTANLLNNFSRDNFRLLLCIREDYIYCLEHVSATIPMLKRNRYQLKAFSYGQARQVICSPDPNLVTKEITDAIISRLDTGENGEIDPAILSLFMHELFEKGNGKITQENLNLFGDNIILEFYEEGKKLISEHSVKFLEDRLVTSDGFRCNLSYNDALIYGITNDELEILKNKRIITVEKVGKNQLGVELSHDILCPVVLKSRQERRHKEETEKYIAQAKALKKRQLVIASFSVLAMSLVCLFAYLFFEIKEQRDQTLVSQSRFVAKEAVELAKKGEFVKAMALLTEVYPKDMDNPERPLVREVYDALRELNDSSKLIEKVLSGHNKGVSYAGFMPTDNGMVTLSSDNTIRLWSGKGRCEYIFNVKTKSMYEERKKKSDKKRLWGEEVGKEISKLKGVNLKNWAASVSPAGNLIATFSEDSTVVVRSILRGDSLGVLKDPDSYITSVLFCPDGKCILTTSGDCSIKLWDSESLENITTLKGHTDKIVSTFFSQDGRKIVSASNDGTVRVWYRDGSSSPDILYTSNYDLTYANFNKAADKVIISFMNDTVRVWNLPSYGSAGEIKDYYCGSRSVYESNFNYDETSFITVANDNAAKIFDCNSGLCKHYLKGHSDRVVSANFNRDNNSLLTASADGTAILWNLDNDTIEDKTLTKIVTDVWNYALSPDGQSIAAVATDNSIGIFDINGRCVKVLPKQNGWVKNIDFSSDGKTIVALLNGNMVKEWDLDSGECVNSYNATPEKLKSIGRRIESMGTDKDILCSMKSRDGKYHVVSKRDNSVELYGTDTCKVIKTFKGHLNYVESVDFNNDCSLMLTASRDCTARIWDVKSGECLSVLRGHERQLNSAVFVDGGKKILTLSNDNTIRIWTVPTSQELIDKVQKKLNGYRLSSEDRYKYYID